MEPNLINLFTVEGTGRNHKPTLVTEATRSLTTYLLLSQTYHVFKHQGSLLNDPTITNIEHLF